MKGKDVEKGLRDRKNVDRPVDAEAPPEPWGAGTKVPAGATVEEPKPDSVDPRKRVSVRSKVSGMADDLPKSNQPPPLAPAPVVAMKC